MIVTLVPEQVVGAREELSAPRAADDAHAAFFPHLRKTIRVRPYRAVVPSDAAAPVTSHFVREVTQLPDGRRQTFYSAPPSSRQTPAEASAASSAAPQQK